jgi:hypothetical protein
LAVRWQDVDLIELDVTLRTPAWAGTAPAYVTRDELRQFADALDAVAGGGTAARFASLDAGQPDLGFAHIDLYEYSRARRLGLRVHLGFGSAAAEDQTPRYGELRAAAPVERGALAAFAQGIRAIARDSAGEGTLPVLPDWP